MADSTTKPTSTAPPPSAPAASPPRVQPEKIEARRSGFDALRPVRYGSSFIGGTVKSGLDGLSVGGRKGLRLGLITGGALWFLTNTSYIAVPLAFAVPSIYTVAYMGVLGFAGGALLAGALGTLTGGYRGVTREMRREKYADDLAVKEEIRRDRHVHRDNYRDLYEHHRRSASYNLDRLQQQERNREQTWQERIEGERSGSAGRGL